MIFLDEEGHSQQFTWRTIEFENSAFACERQLIEQAFSLNHAGKYLTTVLDDAHLMDLATLRK